MVTPQQFDRKPKKKTKYLKTDEVGGEDRDREELEQQQVGDSAQEPLLPHLK
jgi:hypothetical protein